MLQRIGNHILCGMSSVWLYLFALMKIHGGKYLAQEPNLAIYCLEILGFLVCLGIGIRLLADKAPLAV